MGRPQQKLKAFSLIEVVAFIIVMSLLVAGLMRAFMVASNHTFRLQHSGQELNLAQARMELLLGQKALLGFDRFSDPCNEKPAPAVCLTSANYRVTSTIRYDRQRGKNFKVINVIVRQAGRAGSGIMLTTLVAANQGKAHGNQSQ